MFGFGRDVSENRNVFRKYPHRSLPRSGVDVFWKKKTVRPYRFAVPGRVQLVLATTSVFNFPSVRRAFRSTEFKSRTSRSSGLKCRLADDPPRWSTVVQTLKNKLSLLAWRFWMSPRFELYNTLLFIILWVTRIVAKVVWKIFGLGLGKRWWRGRFGNNSVMITKIPNLTYKKLLQIVRKRKLYKNVCGLRTKRSRCAKRNTRYVRKNLRARDSDLSRAALRRRAAEGHRPAPPPPRNTTHSDSTIIHSYTTAAAYKVERSVATCMDAATPCTFPAPPAHPRPAGTTVGGRHTLSASTAAEAGRPDCARRAPCRTSAAVVDTREG